jgi:hypothetical protein
VAVMATVAKGYDLDYAWRAVGEAYRGAGTISRLWRRGSHRAPGGVQGLSGWASPQASSRAGVL